MSSSILRPLRRYFATKPGQIPGFNNQAVPPRRPLPPPPGPTSKLGAVTRYSPWSKSFPGSWQTRTFLQSLAYAIGIIVATNYVDSALFSSQTGYASHTEIKVAIEKLRAAFPEEDRVSTNSDVLREHGSSDNSYHPASPHAVVVRPYSLIQGENFQTFC